VFCSWDVRGIFFVFYFKILKERGKMKEKIEDLKGIIVVFIVVGAFVVGPIYFI